VLGIDVRAGGSTPGRLYALGSSGRVYVIDTTTGAASGGVQLTADASDTTDAFTALSGTEYGVDFNPVSDRLRVVSDTGQNLRIDVDTGAVITDTPIGGTTARAGISGAAYTNAFAEACRSALYYIDASTDQLLTTADPNGGTVGVVGALGVDASNVSDLEIATAADGSNSANAVLVVGGVPTLYSIDLSTGAATSVAAVARLDANELVRDTANSAPTTSPAQAAGDVFALTESGRLVSFAATAPQKLCTSATFSGQASGEAIVGIDVRPATQQLYALGNGGRLYTVDTATATVTLASNLVPALGDLTAPYAGLVGTQFGFDFNPVNDLLRVTSDTGQNFRIALDGAVTTDVALNPAGPVTLESAYSNNFVGAAVISTYFTIDATSDSLQRLSGNAINGVLETVGAGLGAGDVQGVAGFDILGPNNQGLAALTIGSSASSDLFTVNLSTGAATRVNTIGGGERVRGLAYARTSAATVLVLTSDNHLVSFKPTTPGTIDSDVTVTGLQGTETIVGIDVRPSTGQLYAVTDQGHVYTVDATTGAVSGTVTLAANPVDTLAPVYAGLSGTRFGLDFSSVDGLLRVQSETGQNLRVDVDTGLVSADPNFASGVQIVGSAYSNDYSGATTTTHYELDVASGSLVRQTSIAGALATVGAFNAGTTFQLEGGFDIAGGENGLPVAALMPTGATGSTLYRVNLANGALTSLGTIGTGATVVRALAVRLQ
jgi:trimeric autotransporter adhesin